MHRWRILSGALLAGSLALLALRAAIGLGWSVPALGALGNPLVVRSDFLRGWLLHGEVLGRWSGAAWWAGVVWEWLPAVLFAAGLWTALRHGPVPGPPRLRVPERARPWLGFALFLALALAATWGCFRGIPHIQDSIAQQFQAQIFASGRAWAPAPRHGEFFFFEFLLQDRGRWYAQYPPGHAALLALGVAARVPWLVNPLLGALTGVALYHAARRALGPGTASTALALYCISPFTIFMAGERMNHVGLLFFFSVALAVMAPALARRPRPLRAGEWLVAGLALGLAVTVRPLCAAALAAVTVPAALLETARAKRGRVLPIAGAAGLVGTAFLTGTLPWFLFNAATTGSPLLSGYVRQWGSSGWGFGASQWGPPHTLARGLMATLSNWDAAARHLFAWPVPALLPLLGLAALRLSRMERVLVATLGALSLAYLPYFFQDVALGPRFLYGGVPAFAILSARGLRGAGLLWARRFGGGGRAAARLGLRIAFRAAAWCTAAGLAVNMPLFVRWYGSAFWGTHRELVDAAESALARSGPAIVFVRDYNRARTVELLQRGVPLRTAHAAVQSLDEEWIDAQIREADRLPAAARGQELRARLEAAMRDPAGRFRRRRLPWEDYRGPGGNYAQGFWANTPWPERRRIFYALDLGERNARLLSDHPDRSGWLAAWDPAARCFRLVALRNERDGNERVARMHNRRK